MQHVGWKQSWATIGGSSGLFGHFTDPDAFLYSWLIDGNRSSFDAYKVWLSSIKDSRFFGCDRNLNPAVAQLVSAYQHTADPMLLGKLRSIGTKCVAQTIDWQNKPLGILWHPLWINRYWDMTRDFSLYEKLLAFGEQQKGKLAYTNNSMGLAALIWELFEEKEYLTAVWCGVIENYDKYALNHDVNPPQWQLDREKKRDSGPPHRSAMMEHAYAYWYAAVKEAKIESVICE
jgi:hypothetical protein